MNERSFLFSIEDAHSKPVNGGIRLQKTFTTMACHSSATWPHLQAVEVMNKCLQEGL